MFSPFFSQLMSCRIWMQAAEPWNVVFAKATISLHVLWKFAQQCHTTHWLHKKMELLQLHGNYLHQSPNEPYQLNHFLALCALISHNYIKARHNQPCKGGGGRELCQIKYPGLPTREHLLTSEHCLTGRYTHHYRIYTPLTHIYTTIRYTNHYLIYTPLLDTQNTVEYTPQYLIYTYTSLRDIHTPTRCIHHYGIHIPRPDINIITGYTQPYRIYIPYQIYTQLPDIHTTTQ